MRKILVSCCCLLVIGLCLMAYNAGKIQGFHDAIFQAEPFIVELPEIGDDTFTVYVDYGDDEVHEYTGFIG